MSTPKEQIGMLVKAKELNTAVSTVLGNKAMEGFEKAYIISDAIVKLNDLLTPEYMKPIMAMQGNRLGFRTDRDKEGGYPEPVVKRCLIEAVLMGLQPYGNQFNIIAANMYPTKEGCGYMLDNIDGLKYNIVCDIKSMNKEKTSALVEGAITWQMNDGATTTKTIPIPIKIDAYASVDSIIGKGTRKGRAWLLSNIKGIEITDGDVTDAIITRDPQPEIDKEAERITLMIQDAKTLDELLNLEKQVKPEQMDLFKQRREELA